MTQHEQGRRIAWDCFAASLLGLNNHPGQTKGDARRMTLEEIADMADAMLEIRDLRFQETNDEPTS